MSVAAIVALAHDLMITVGVYALTGFEVTPATVTGFLTILGFSLYDTVVVFDKVRENTSNITASTRRTYAESANLAVNQTLVRSINTSIAALLPVGAILYVGAFQLGSGPLKDLALALFVGMAAGTYSSIFIATPLLAQLKMREPAMQAQAKRVYARRGATRADGRRRDRRGRPAPRSGPDEAEERARRRAVRRPPGPAAAGRPLPKVGPADEQRGQQARPAATPGPVQARQAVTHRRAGDAELAQALTDPGPRRPGLPRARGRVQGHRAAARPTTTGFSLGRRRAGGGRSRRRRVASPSTRWSGSRRAASSSPRRSRLRSASGFVPVRKAGKLPGATYSQAYALEYGEATLEIHAGRLRRR